MEGASNVSRTIALGVARHILILPHHLDGALHRLGAELQGAGGISGGLRTTEFEENDQVPF